MNKTDKIYNIADNLDSELISDLTNELDFQKITERNDSGTKNQNKKFLFKRLSLAASIAVMTIFFWLVTMGIGIAANFIIPRFFPGIGTVDVEPQAVRELAEPVYLENPSIYNVAIDYAAFIRNGDGSGTLLLEYTYVFGTTQPKAEINKIFAGDFAEGEEPSEEDLAEAAEYGNETARYKNFSYAAEPCEADEANNNLVVPEISYRNVDLRKKYNYENMQIRPLGDIIENIEESDYYKVTFDNGQTAVIHLTPIDYEPAQSLWTDEAGGFKIRVTPYSQDNFRYGIEVFPTEDWSDTIKFSIQFLPLNAVLDGNYENYEDKRFTDRFDERELNITAFPHETKKPRFEWNDESIVPVIPDNVYKDLKGRGLNGFNNFTVGFKGEFYEFLNKFANYGSLFKALEERGELEDYLKMMEEGGLEFRVYKEEDFWIKRINIHSIFVNAIFDENKAKRQKIKLPDGDGVIESEQEINIRGLRYWIDSVTREGDKIEINYTSESDRIRMANESLTKSERIALSGDFRVDGYESKIEYKNLRTNKSHPAIIVEGVGKNVKSLDIYLLYAHFYQSNSWTVDISDSVK